ncbi:MAG: peptide chain release factor 2 [Deltaproteobacteria bacterium]|nr:peptide chain release factor 2 [Candidatus Anaeroferrophillus wilburensis]MBN2888909.1 peptide chain release factor 2 [Deltaproteobacteria bacterium]
MNTGGIFDVASLEKRLGEIERISAREDFWQDQQQATEILKERTALTQEKERWQQVEHELEEITLLAELLKEEEDAEGAAELKQRLSSLEKSFSLIELEKMMAAEHDRRNAIVSINAGAGGTEAQDWAEMLLRMYLRWAEKRSWKTEIVDILAMDEGGIKSATFTVSGDYVYGNFRSEIGIHRLVRISPFDAGSRRHTSFASVFVFPEIDDDVQIEINDKDLRIDTYRASGAGGQHVNKTDSAVRITHLPSGIVVQCQNERSQHKNKAMAMKILKARLYEAEMAQRQEEIDKVEGTKKEIAWGSQIRSYILHPYQMVKDHRTDHETGNVTQVLDGNLDSFVEAYLLNQMNLQPENRDS